MGLDLAEWEARLALEGMPAELPQRASLRLDPVAAEALTTDDDIDGRLWAASSDAGELARFEQLTAWLPVEDLVLLALVRGGQSQRSIARQFGVTQPAITQRLHRARQRLQALDAVPMLPEGRGRLAASIAEHWRGPSSKVMTPGRMAALIVKVTETWCVTVAAEGLGLTECSARGALDSLRAEPSPHLVACVDLLEVIRSHPLRSHPPRSLRRALSLR